MSIYEFDVIYILYHQGCNTTNEELTGSVLGRRMTLCSEIIVL